MGGRALLVLLVGLIIISGTIFFNIAHSSKDISSNTDNYYRNQTARNIAQGGANLGLLQLANKRDWRTGFPMMDMAGGKVSVRLVDTTFSGRAVIAVISTGHSFYGTSMETRATSIAYAPAKFQPPGVKAAITTNNDVKVNGGFIIDGRDHTAGGALVAGKGIYGIWTTGVFTMIGGASIGGTALGVDFAPSVIANPAIIKQLQVTGVPGTPDSILGGLSNGFPEGTLKAIAQSRAGGSQYTTNPASLSYPLKGVTYVELPSGGVWNAANVSGGGMLIVHNGAKNALITNTSGNFVGLAISDDIIHLHSNFLGAVISLTPAPSAGNVIGNAIGSVLYSSEVLLKTTEMLFTFGNGSAANVIAWKE